MEPTDRRLRNIQASSTDLPSILDKDDALDPHEPDKNGISGQRCHRLG